MHTITIAGSKGGTGTTTWVQETRGTDTQPYTVLVLNMPDGSRLVAHHQPGSRVHGTVFGSDGTDGWRHIHALRVAGLVTATFHGPDTYGHTTYHAVAGS